MIVRKALTFRASSIGDCLMGKYLLENIHAQFPEARLGLVVANRAGMIRDLLAAYPWLEIIEANRRSPKALLSLWKNFHGSDLVVTQYAGKQGGSFGFASKLAARMLAKRGGLVGFTDASKWNGILYDQLLSARSDIAVADHERGALRAAGLPMSLPFPALEFVRDNTARTKFNLETGKFIIVHLFAGNSGRGLHPDKKRELLNILAEKLPRIRLVISGGTNDQEEALRIAESIPATVIAGKTTLQELMNLIFESRGVVSVDTGVAHIAAQLGKPLIVMRTCLGRSWWLPKQYGEEAPVTVFSRDDLCNAGHIYKDFPDCINAISIDELVSVLQLQRIASGVHLKAGQE
ncbi:MAG: glycosyltransferase family 9 protein [Minisyncoccia bacterium]|jgi:ADP-heptose:LPS heptosyltransferase